MRALYMRTPRPVVLILLGAGLVGSAAMARGDANDKLPLALFLGMLKSQGQEQCAQYRAKAPLATSEFERLKADISVNMQCECMPAQLAALAAKPDLPKTATQEESLALVEPLIERCAGLGMRELLVSGCPIAEKPDPGIKDQKAYCACIARQVEKLTDADIVAEAKASKSDFDARVQARKEGKPALPRGGRMLVFDNLCRAEQGAPPKG